MGCCNLAELRYFFAAALRRSAQRFFIRSDNFFRPAGVRWDPGRDCAVTVRSFGDAVTTRVVPGAALLLSWAWIAAISSSTCRRSASSPFNASSSGRLSWSISGYAEKRTRTSTPLRALEPESSASANSAISAKDFKSMFFDL